MNKETKTRGTPPPSRTPLPLKLVVLFVFSLAMLAGIKYFAIHSEDIATVEFWIIPLISSTLLTLVWGLLEQSIIRQEKLKYDFLTVASHRLRTPLTRATWSVDGLSEMADTEDEQNLLNNIRSTISEMSEIANHLLDATESAAGSLYYDYIFEIGSLGALTRQVVADYTPGLQQKDLSVTVDIAENLPQVNLDRERLRMAIGVLLENAIIYTPQNGRIGVRVYQEGNNLVCSIEDSGIGIPREIQQFLFTKFFRAKEAISIDRDRAGLGLSIAREVIRKHGGEIFASSGGKDQGSKFWFTIPIAR